MKCNTSTDIEINRVLRRFKNKEINASNAGQKISSIINSSNEEEINLDLRGYQPINYLGFKLRKDKTLIIKARDIGEGLGAESKGTIIIKQAKKIKSELLGQNAKGTIRIRNYDFKYFDEEKLNNFSIQVYPTKSFSKFFNKTLLPALMPIQLIQLINLINFDLDTLRKTYLRLFKEAKKLMRRFELRIDVRTPKLIINYSKEQSGDYVLIEHKIRLHSGYYFEITLFHEIIHSILSVENIYWSSSELMEIPLSNGTIEKKNFKFINEGLTDYLTKYYFNNIDKKRKYANRLMEIIGYPKEVKFINKVLEDFNKKGINLKQAIRILFKTRNETRLMRVLMNTRKPKDIINIISRLTKKEKEELVKGLKNKVIESNLEMALLYLLNEGLAKSFINIHFYKFPIELRKGTLNIIINSSKLEVKINGGTLNLLNPINYNEINLSGFKKGVINLITTIKKIKQEGEGLINAESIKGLEDKQGVIISKKITKEINCGPNSLINAEEIEGDMIINGCVISQKIKTKSKVRVYEGDKKEELLTINKQLLELNNELINNLKYDDQDKMIPVNEIKIDVDKINKINQEQIKLVNKQRGIINKYKISGLITESIIS